PTVPDPAEGAAQPDPFGPPPDNRTTDPNGTVYQQPLYLADVHQEPGDLTGRHARADTPPPMPGMRAPEYGPDGRRQPVGSAPTGTLALPPNSERLLPARLDHPAQPRRRQPFLLAAVLVAGVAAAAVVVALTLPEANGSTGQTAAPPATPSAAATTATTQAPPPTTPPAPVPGAPTNLRLTDNRDSVSLKWAYPADAEGPVLVSGGRTGQNPRAFQQMPAGSTEYVVYGLNPQQNYCFTVAVAYSTDRIASTPPACTKR
ncbi:MAG: fibronectin type III domain-containing protein, partial [Actinoplanes sp.]